MTHRAVGCQLGGALATGTPPRGVQIVNGATSECHPSHTAQTEFSVGGGVAWAGAGSVPAS
jgi:hypothetical protein